MSRPSGAGPSVPGGWLAESTRRLIDPRWILTCVVAAFMVPLGARVGLAPVDPDPHATRELEQAGAYAVAAVASVGLAGLIDVLGWMMRTRPARARRVRATRVALVTAWLTGLLGALSPLLPAGLGADDVLRLGVLLVGTGLACSVLWGLGAGMLAPIVLVAAFSRPEIMPWGANLLFNPRLAGTAWVVGATALTASACAYAWADLPDARGRRTPRMKAELLRT